MTGLIIKINRVGDPPTDLFPPKESVTAELDMHSVTILEHGTQNGLSSLMFGLTNPDTGEHYIAQLTGTLLKNLAAGLRGAEQNWEDNPR